MIFFDVTKTAGAKHRSGLTRVSGRLLAEFGSSAKAVQWRKCFAASGTREAIKFSERDWVLTAELFSEPERPGFWQFLRQKPCRLAAIFHDAIPIKWPDITWPQSVARHPEYMKMLGFFDVVWAVSETSKAELLDWWRWIGLEVFPPVEVLPLGADFRQEARSTGTSQNHPALLCVGILEPRKNQSFLLDACAALWSEGLKFDLHLVGRMNPHFAGPILDKIKNLKKRFDGLHYHGPVDDEKLDLIYRNSRAAVFPSLAEGCGLPVIESLWKGLPCIASDLPTIRENASAGGCFLLPVNDQKAWEKGLKNVLTDVDFVRRLSVEAQARPLPTWAEAASILKAELL